MSTPARCIFAVALGVASSHGLRAQIQPQLGVRIPMRDGVILVADMWRPQAPGRYPVLLARTPYMKTQLWLAQWGEYFAGKGYVFVAQDVRGRGDSDGQFAFLTGDGPDGYDTIEWLAKQPWSSGKVGTLGVSYLGAVQWLAAREHPPHLACMAPTAAIGRWFEEIPYMGGAFAYQFALDFANGTSGRIGQDENNADAAWERILAHRPLLTSDSVLGRTLPLYRAWLQHPDDGPYWSRLHFTASDFAAIAIPTLTVTGLFDNDQPGALFYWRGLMANAPHHERHFLLVGPWLHVRTWRGGANKVGELDLPPESILDMKALHLAFFDWCLKRTSDRFDAPAAKIWVTGANVWRTFDRYPPPGAATRKLYLASRGRANSLEGDGRLGWELPTDAAPDSFTFDPQHPLPGTLDDHGQDRRLLERRSDVLVYTSGTLTAAVEVIGDVRVSLVAASDGFDTDFTAILSDVLPDGRAVQLGASGGIRRARYRNGYGKQELLTPGKPETYRIELFDIAHRFQPGHRIRLDVSSSAVPLYNPNQNTGLPIATDTTWRRAKQTIYHDQARASFIALPVMGSAVP